MPGNSFNQIFRLTTFGESHGPAIGGILDGCPAGLKLNLDQIQSDLNRRRPGQSEITTSRDEKDKVEFLSGILGGTTTGAPIAFVIFNQDHKPADYDHLEKAFRPSHADYTYQKKYGIRDHRGGGRASARETIARVVGGTIAKQLIQKEKIEINAFVSQVGKIKMDSDLSRIDFSETEKNLVRCPDPKTAEKMIAAIEAIQKKGDTLGGIITGVIKNVPIGLGEPVFDKLHADLGKAMLTINAVKGFEIGSGFASVTMKGSEHNDIFTVEKAKIKTLTNHSGGIQGGISNGEDIVFRVAFKPVSTLMQKQQSVNAKGEEIVLEAKGRHDPCVVPRAVPIVESMAALVLADHCLRSKLSKT